MAYGAGDFRRDIDVSRETFARLETHAALLRKWQAKINLVSQASLDDLWRRHMLDSAQVLSLAPPMPAPKQPAPIQWAPRQPVWLDIGSGAGFPGLVLAIMGAGHVHLVESDARKCAFLLEAARVTAAPVTVHHARLEALDPWPVDYVTARACAPLSRLLELAAPFFGPRTTGLFPKGQNVEYELTQAAKYWTMTWNLVVSRSDPSGRIVVMEGVSRDHQGSRS